MPLPASVVSLQDDSDLIETSLAGVTTALAALPATPTAADLPSIVQIVADLNTAAASLQVIVDKILTVLATTRINQ